MIDFYITYSSESADLTWEEALNYFNKIYPNTNNKYYASHNFIVVYTCAQDNCDSVDFYWNTQRNQCLFFAGDIVIPDNLVKMKNNKDAVFFVSELFELYGIDIFKQFSGNFNAVAIDSRKQELTIVNSKLGLCPLYYSRNNRSIIASTHLGIFSTNRDMFQLNHSVVLQHCIYNYPVSTYSFLDKVRLLPSANVLVYKNNTVLISKYWDITNIINTSIKRISFKKSIDIIDEALDTLIKKVSSENRKIGISLTGGWDGRIILSYALKYLDREQIILYSHGIPESPDVYLPKSSAKKLKLHYVPVLLDDPTYLNNQMKWAKETVIFSDGSRQFNRAHYLYNMSFLRNEYKISTVVSGNGGSNLLKISNFKPCDVANKNVIELLMTDHIESTIKKHFDFYTTHYQPLFQNLNFYDFLETCDLEYLSSYWRNTSKSGRFISFMIADIEKRYFGAELQTYKHIIKNYSPFFDDNFITSLTNTAFINLQGDKGLTKSYSIARLYATLARRNNLQLSKEPTDRGFSMYEIANPIMFPIMLLKYFNNRRNKPKNVDYYCLDQLDEKYFNEFFPNRSSDQSLLLSNDTFITNYVSIHSFQKMLNDNRYQ